MRGEPVGGELGGVDLSCERVVTPSRPDSGEAAASEVEDAESDTAGLDETLKSGALGFGAARRTRVGNEQ